MLAKLDIVANDVCFNRNMIYKIFECISMYLQSSNFDLYIEYMAIL